MNRLWRDGWFRYSGRSTNRSTRPDTKRWLSCEYAVPARLLEISTELPGAFALAPDGSAFAFLRGGHLYLQTFGSLEPQDLGEAPAAPDGDATVHALYGLGVYPRNLEVAGLGLEQAFVAITEAEEAKQS